MFVRTMLVTASTLVASMALLAAPALAVTKTATSAGASSQSAVTGASATGAVGFSGYSSSTTYGGQLDGTTGQVSATNNGGVSKVKNSTTSVQFGGNTTNANGLALGATQTDGTAGSVASGMTHTSTKHK